MIDPKKKLDRTLMFIPGFLSWAMLLMPIWLGVLLPQLAAWILTFFSVYWLYMAGTHARGLWIGYRAYKHALTVDWYKKCTDLSFSDLPTPETLPKSLKDIRHFILIPTFRESFAILDATFNALLNQTFPISQSVIIVGTEEDGKELIAEGLGKIKEKYGSKLPEILQYVHPKGIPDEITGVASPNRTWAATHAVEELQKRNVDFKNYIFTTFDSDVILHKEYLSCLTFNYLTDGNRYNHFFETAVHLFDTNLWEVPLMSRIEANNLTFGLLSSWSTDLRVSETFSCYSTALDTVVAANYWDVKFIDDTVFFWRAYQARKGDFSAKYFHIPISSDATTGKDYVTAHKNLFRQLVRWGWGSVSTVIALKMFLSGHLENSKWDDKLLWTYLKLERHMIARTSVFLITFGFTIITFVNTRFTQSPAVYRLPQIISVFLSAGIIMLIPLTLLRRKIYPVPANFPTWRKFAAFFEAPLVMINLLTYSFIPWLYAETMMMFGKLPKVTFYTPKTR